MTITPAAQPSSRTAKASSGVGLSGGRRRVRRPAPLQTAAASSAKRAEPCRASWPMTTPAAAAPPTASSRYAASPAVARRTVATFIRAGPGAERAAQARGAEGQAAGEARLELGVRAALDQRAQLRLRLRVGVVGDPRRDPLSHRLRHRVRNVPVQGTIRVMRAVDVIAAKRDGAEIADDELRELVLGYARDEVADYQMSAFLMAGFINGFSPAEAAALTAAMVASGETLDLSALSGPTVDKHSTGGVGDGTTLVVAPLAAALGMQVVKLSGRGLGHTGGTLDKLDAIPGMRTELSGRELIAQVEEIGLAVCAQTADLVPADKAMYALRDVTATVANTALIASSVMSKKLAGGAGAILLDVKVGSGAFMKDVDAARELAELCVHLGKEGGRATAALITDMDQPLADAVGNATEVREAIEVLRGEREGRFTDLCVALAGHMAALTGVAEDPDAGREAAIEALANGDALERFRRFVAAQGGDADIVDDPSRLPQPAVHPRRHRGPRRRAGDRRRGGDRPRRRHGRRRAGCARRTRSTSRWGSTSWSGSATASTTTP